MISMKKTKQNRKRGGECKMTVINLTLRKILLVCFILLTIAEIVVIITLSASIIFRGFALVLWLGFSGTSLYVMVNRR